MQKILYESKYDCCGCGACYSVCPVGAITMEADEEGFQYPVINREICIDCKKCETVCPLKDVSGDAATLHIFAAKNRNEEVRMKSSSGGIFSILAEYVEAQKGVIYGAAFDETYSVRHRRAESKTEWKAFCGSKYVQSDIGNTFREVCEDLRNGRTVLFSGTPCQVAGLKNYVKSVGVESGRLYTVDIICHGTPSPRIWEDYLRYLEDREKRKIGEIDFRDKKFLGWHDSTLTVRDKEGNVLLSETQGENLFFQLFLCHEVLRPSCYRCKYASFQRRGDITLGDYWGVEKEYPRFDDNKGISLVMINSEGGEGLWQNINREVEYFEVTKEQCLQPNLQKPSQESANRKGFWRWYNEYGLKRTGQRKGLLLANKTEKMWILLCRCREKIKRVLKRL